MVIYSGSWEEHLQHLSRVLQKISETGLILNVTKCEWAKQEMQYLGFLLGNGEVRPQVDKVEAVRSCSRPSLDWLDGIKGLYQSSPVSQYP